MSAPEYRLAIFASGAGSNAGKIIEYFEGHTSVSVAGVYTNRPDAGVVQIAGQYNIPVHVFSNEDLKSPENLLKTLSDNGVKWIILAGFLRKVPSEIISAYPNHILNIHPALLPKFGGKGMYGIHVHKAVKEAGETETGITIHYVNENYDDGAIVRQEKVSLELIDTPEQIAEKVRGLEHFWYPRVIEQVVTSGK